MAAHHAQDPESLLPLGASAFHILLALADGEKHGASISAEVEASTRGTIRLMPGALYRYLKQMLADGWIAETVHGGDDDQRRRYYRLTPWGRSIARSEAARLEAVVHLARSRELLAAHAR